MNAEWIVLSGLAERESFFARSFFRVGEKAGVALRITANPAFRAWLDGKYLGDGPARGWPHRYFFEEYLRDLPPGDHELRVLVHGQKLGSFVHRPGNVGLCAEIVTTCGLHLPTGPDWEVARDRQRSSRVPRIFPLAGDFESLDARNAGLEWMPAEIVANPLCAAVDLQPRDVLPPAQKLTPFPSPCQTGTLPSPETRHVVPVRSFVQQDGGEDISIHSSQAFGLVAELEVSEGGTCALGKSPWRWFIDGVEVVDKSSIAPGRYLVAAFVRDFYCHLTEIPWVPPAVPGGIWRSCALVKDAGPTRGPWSIVRFDHLKHREDDFVWPEMKDDYREHLEALYRDEVDRLGKLTASPSEFGSTIDGRLETPEVWDLFFEDPHAEFMSGEPADSVEIQEAGGELLIPAAAGVDAEYHFDLGSQRAGFIQYEITAPLGTQIDLFGLEHVTPAGVRQHTGSPNCNKNGFRYIARDGRQNVFSVVLRSGRHWFLRVRNPSGPVTLHRIALLESGYPAHTVEPFTCSNPVLTHTWAVANRTMELCADDTFVDCPLYEQALWIGDAYAQQLYALHAWNAQDISLRCIRLGADSLRDFPIVISQAPSSWNAFIPVWSMLWGFSVWDYFFFTGDRAVLADLWPDFRRNLHGLLFHLNSQGLFDAPFWNLFEWADIDWRRRVVLYNSLFIAGLLDRGVAAARELGDLQTAFRWESTARKVRWAVRQHWDNEKNAYPDSLDAAGLSTNRFCIHTQFLASLFGGGEEPHRDRLVELMRNPPADFSGVASPFALQFLYEALEQAGEMPAVLQSIRQYYGEMLRAGATTFWEALPGSTTSPEGFPTRSHCHGWASAPVYFLPRIVLGIRQTAPGGKSYTVSPCVDGLEQASGAVAGAMGPVSVRWHKAPGKILDVVIRHPAGCDVRYEADRSAEGLSSQVRFEIAGENEP